VWPFDAPQYLILNIAVGGTWGGEKGVDDAVFPQRMEVDYVRVYQIAH
jgi:beta-glucanase (GH16 family)